MTSTGTARALFRDRLTTAVPSSATTWVAGDIKTNALGVGVGVGVGVLVGLGVKVAVGGAMPVPWIAKS